MLDAAALDTLFRTARTFSAAPDTWLPKPVGEDLLRQVWDLAKMGPTSANCLPARVLFVTSPAGKDRLVPLMDEGNQRKTREAPATAIIGMDLAFPDKLPVLFPHTDAKSWFEGKPDHIRTTAMRNSSLQGAYLILAARALGLDCGPMSGFDNAKVDAEFFPGTQIKSNFIVNLGYGNRATLHPRSPRLSFDEACRIV
jgi:3-hydroxypropanoate dehydrogenase